MAVLGFRMIESKIFFRFILPALETVPSQDKAHMSQVWVDRRTSSHFVVFLFKEAFANNSQIVLN